MANATMVKVTAAGDFIIFKTVTRERKSSSFYIRRDEISRLNTTNQLVAWDSSFAVFTRDREEGTVNVHFYWLNLSGEGPFTGRMQSVTIMFEQLMSFVEQSAFEGRPQTWSALSIEPRSAPRFVFRSSRNLHEVISNKLTRRKLCKFLRDNFRWRSSTEIIFTDDFIPRSFFTEMRKCGAGICGGLILHGQENMEKAYYGIHT